MSLKQYDPESVSVIVGGHIVSGIADGTFVMLERNNDNYSRVAGADGENVRTRTNDKSGKLTITLLQSSMSNGVLQGYANADELSNSGLVPIAVKDANGTDVATAANAWVVKPANREYGKEVTNRQWVIETDELILAGGGIDPIQ